MASAFKRARNTFETNARDGNLARRNLNLHQGFNIQASPNLSNPTPSLDLTCGLLSCIIPIPNNSQWPTELYYSHPKIRPMAYQAVLFPYQIKAGGLPSCIFPIPKSSLWPTNLYYSHPQNIACGLPSYIILIPNCSLWPTKLYYSHTKLQLVA